MNSENLINISFRNYRDCSDKVIELYSLNHKYQTVEYVEKQFNDHCKNFNKCKMTIWDAINKLDYLLDESDPDLNLPQIVHAFQVAEGLRKTYPDNEWLPLIGLIHDLGKIIALPEYGNQPQWSTVGDTFPVGCKFSKKIIFHEFFDQNKDVDNPKYNTKYGIYLPNCGLDNVKFSFGHDEYMYQVLVHNRCKIPDEGLKIIRYHSFYSWHTHNAYNYLMNEEDYKIRELCKKFNICDLYTKNDFDVPDQQELKDYYQKLIKKYFLDDFLEF